MPIQNTGPKIKRNEPCPCGSGKKAKHCCLPRIQKLAAIPPEIRRRLLAESILQKPYGEIEEPPYNPSGIDVENCTVTIQEESEENNEGPASA